jgi:Flp pilus assembly protein TadB
MQDPEEHLRHSIQRAADRYYEGLQKTHLPPNEKLARAIVERAVREASEDYQQQISEELEERTRHTLDMYHQRDQARKHAGARAAVIICPPIALAFGIIAWINLNANDAAMGLVYSIGSLMFLAMLTRAVYRLRK